MLQHLESLPLTVNQDGVPHGKDNVADFRPICLIAPIYGQRNNLESIPQIDLAKGFSRQWRAGRHHRFDGAGCPFFGFALEDFRGLFQVHLLFFHHALDVLFAAIHQQMHV